MSLIETVIASAILLGAFLLFTRLFTFGLRGVSKASQVAVNIAQAESQIAKLESLAAQNSWAALLAQDGDSFPVDGATVELEVLPVTAFSPSTEWEAPFVPLGNARSFDSVLVQATVTITNETTQTSQTRLIARPRRALASPPIELINVPATVAASGSATIRARLLATNGTEIPATFQWYVIPGTGSGTLTVARNNREAAFSNSVMGKSGAAFSTGGDCQLRVRTVYFGELIEVDSAPIGLGP